ncbi:PREDICTED: uncharacterized protein LOC105451291 [Wasmannia auropunctata]|uniref:uncharacterized protein LOC105451291 n=1 Tax=Wasmannia auropunctata TaxID=64793 RepID=UPI0005F0723F|nr:PREDICTED: uncharacterized protein LOC105451291 [Wasmannia auropunctata]
MLALRGLLIFAACRVVVAATPPATARKVYDQRQTGDTNVQIELKDVQVIALLNSELLDDYTDYDYFYDYADFTVKPGNKPTTTSPATTSTEKNDITQVPEQLPSQNSSVPASVANTSPAAATGDTTLSQGEGIPSADPSNGTASDTTPNADNDDDDKSQPGEEEDGAGSASSTTVKPVHALRSQKRCRSGYVPTGDGRCRRASRPWLLSRLLP